MDDSQISTRHCMKPSVESHASKRHWIASYGSIPPEIDADRYPSINAMLEGAMRQFAARPAFRAFGHTLTYADIDRLSSAFAVYLQKVAGVGKGDRVAVMLPNLLAFPIAFIAIARIGAVQVNVNPLYTARELEHQLNDAGVETIVVFDGSTRTLAEVVNRTKIRTVITAGAGDGSGATLPGPAADVMLHGALHGAITLPQALAQGERLAADPVDVNGSDLLFLQYTGGTTGLSKGAALSHRNLVANIEQFKAFMPDSLRPGVEVVVTAIPLYHIFALTVNFLTYFSVGAENWLVANPREVEPFIDVLKAARPTIFVGVNTLYAGLAAHPRLAEVDWSRLRLSAGGGAAVIDIVSERWKSVTGSFIREGYGLSETSPVVSSAVHRRLHGQHGPARAFHRRQAARRRQPRSGHRRGGRDLRQGPASDARLLAAARGQRARFHRGWLLPYRRRRRIRRQGLSEDRRSQEGHGDRLRLQRLPERSGSGSHSVSRRRRMRVYRRAR
ncbi:UNVERIFIED_ORG: AMP-binding enzyme [Burkholderia sp. CF145]|nr:Long-chain-fatty-acid--CoA ligase [Burkholderia sp. BT03]SKD03412.1 AMP-binding enzyme [Paraburkholderia hospita]